MTACFRRVRKQQSFPVSTMLRSYLEDITNNGNVSSHRKLIESLRGIAPHSIAVLERSGDNLLYNCVMYALGLAQDPVFLDLLHELPSRIHASTAFIQFLVDEGYLVKSISPDVGDLIAYHDNTRFRHIGIVVDDGRVRSKWGVGLLYEHAPLETPYSYGNAVCFFRPLKREVVLNAFFEFAKSQ